MNHWRTDSLLKLGRSLVLLLLIGQSALLIHEAGHSSVSADSECQLCLHAKPQLAVTTTIQALVASFDRVAVLSPRNTQAIYFSPVYANSSRGPPRA